MFESGGRHSDHSHGVMPSTDWRCDRDTRRRCAARGAAVIGAPLTFVIVLLGRQLGNRFGRGVYNTLLKNSIALPPFFFE